MAREIIGRAVVGQSGGPTCVINQSLVGIIEEARNHPAIIQVLGARHGVAGILKNQYVDLGKETPATLERVANTPASALGSVRKKPTEAETMEIFHNLEALNVRYFFYIGGNDSAETAHLLNTIARQQDYELRVFHVPKTIDNDLRANDHTPGFGSAARFVACAFMGDDMDNRSLPGIKINVIMGRHAGFLTAASALARIAPGSGPHLIYLPERPFNPDRFVANVREVFERLGRCVVAVSEGIPDEKGEPIAARFTTEIDSHDNKQLSGSGSLGDWLAALIKETYSDGYMGKKVRVRADTFGYLQRSFAGVTSPVDAAEAREVGRVAVRMAMQGNVDGSIAIRRLSNNPYRSEMVLTQLTQVARDTRHMPDEFIDPNGHDVTEAFLEYARPLAGDLPAIGLLEGYPFAVQ